jgi:oligopeptide/dipeptide ABC transporter ATP-binding protein
MENLLTIKNLKVYFRLAEGVSRAVDGLNLEIEKSQTLGLVGESGCGKSVSALSILRLVPPPGEIVEGEIRFGAENLLKLKDDRLRKLRGKKIAMVFQEPHLSLNPVYTIGYQIEEPLRAHLGLNGKKAKERAVRLLREVGIPSPGERLMDYPHQLSGGLRQRAMIAMALACEPELLIADEPTTALDVTIQAQILELFLKLKASHRMSILLITHDLGVVSEVADRIAVMYAGKIVEVGEREQIFFHPLHPYTRGLLEAAPKLGETKKRLTVIPGSVPDPCRRGKGCSFHPRCGLATAQCRLQSPALEEKEEGHKAACFVAK